MTERWVVWYLHWRYRTSTVDIQACESREDAYESASYVELEAEDCVNEIIGIEGPDGFIDLAEYNSVKHALDDARYKRWEQQKDAENAQRQRTITVSGPGGHNYSETWTDKYFDEYHQKWVALFGTSRVSVKEAK